jgi:adenine/guanine phosphoribosyltransferase-like PRPP-binding protein
MIYLIPIIGLPLAMIIAIKIDVAYKEKKRKRVMKSMYDTYNKGYNDGASAAANDIMNSL